MALFQGQDKTPPPLTQIYQIEADNTQEIEEFLLPNPEERERLHKDITMFADLCRLSQSLMRSLHEGSPTSDQLAELSEWRNHYRTNSTEEQGIRIVMEEITRHLNTLLTWYKRDNLQKLLARCQECENLFIIAKRNHAQQGYCSHRCQLRGNR